MDDDGVVLVTVPFFLVFGYAVALVLAEVRAIRKAIEKPLGLPLPAST